MLKPKKPEMIRMLCVRNCETRVAVKCIDVTGKSERDIEKMERGLLRQIDTDEYYVDDVKEYIRRVATKPVVKGKD